MQQRSINPQPATPATDNTIALPHTLFSKYSPSTKPIPCTATNPGHVPLPAGCCADTSATTAAAETTILIMLSM